MEPVCLLQFLLSVLDFFPPVEKEDDEDDEAAEAGQGDGGEDDALAGSDEQLHGPVALLGRGVRDYVQLGVGDDLLPRPRLKSKTILFQLFTQFFFRYSGMQVIPAPCTSIRHPISFSFLNRNG